MQKAITLYIGEMKGIKLETSRLSFMAAKEKAQRDTDTWEVQYGSTAEQLEQYAINTLPPNDVWVDLRTNLSFRQSNKEDESDGKEAKVNKNVIRFEFRSQGKDGEKIIDEFIQVQWIQLQCVMLFRMPSNGICAKSNLLRIIRAICTCW